MCNSEIEYLGREFHWIKLTVGIHFRRKAEYIQKSDNRHHLK